MMLVKVPEFLIHVRRDESWWGEDTEVLGRQRACPGFGM